jgi:hypothetical protein
MARNKRDRLSVGNTPQTVEETEWYKNKHKAPEPVKVRFLVWFSGAGARFKDLKPHHMHAVQRFFATTGVADPNTVAAYDEALEKFGYGRIE